MSTVSYCKKQQINVNQVRFLFDGNKIGKTVAAFPDVNELAHTMAYVVNNYDEATEKGIQAHRRIRDKFTWRKSAETLVNIIGGETWH